MRSLLHVLVFGVAEDPPSIFGIGICLHTGRRGRERYFSFPRVVRGAVSPHHHHQIDVNNETVLLHWCFVLHLFSVILPPPRPHLHIDDTRQFFLIIHTSLFFHFGTLITNPVRSNGLGAAGLSLYCWGGGGRDAAVVFGGRHGLH